VLLAVPASGFAAPEDFQRLVRSQRVAEVTEVDQVDELFR
jgi:hypothetical protein